MDAPTTATEDDAIRARYHTLIASWNDRNSETYAAQFTEDCHLVGFDGSQIDGRAAVAETIGTIFAHHKTQPYYAKVREVQFLTPEVAVLRAVVGMIPPGKADLDPGLNAIQSMVAVKREGAWHIVLFQNTPAQFHGRPDLSAQLTEELKALL